MEQKQAVQTIQKKKESGIFQAITLIALALFWVGMRSLYTGRMSATSPATLA